jgi:hypothetical protein
MTTGEQLPPVGLHNDIGTGILRNVDNCLPIDEEQNVNEIDSILFALLDCYALLLVFMRVGVIRWNSLNICKG